MLFECCEEEIFFLAPKTFTPENVAKNYTQQLNSTESFTTKSVLKFWVYNLNSFQVAQLEQPN